MKLFYAKLFGSAIKPSKILKVFQYTHILKNIDVSDERCYICTVRMSFFVSRISC